MTMVAELQTCGGFTVEGPAGCLGWVEETWLDDTGHPAAIALRTREGRRALLPAGEVLAVDPDAQELLVGSAVELRALEAPRIDTADGTIAATWRTTDEHLVPAAADAHAVPKAPALAAARAATAHRERAPWRTIVLVLGSIALLVALEIGLAYGVAYLVTGRPY